MRIILGTKYEGEDLNRVINEQYQHLSEDQQNGIFMLLHNFFGSMEL